MTNYFKNKGYSVQKEFTGSYHKETVKGLKQGQNFVARFCGDWIGSDTTKKAAEMLCLFDDDKKTINIL